MAGVSYLTESEILKIREILRLPHLEIQVRPDWGSQHPHHRESIHGEIKKKQAKAYPFSDSSISHCSGLGGFAFTVYDANHVIQIGFDIEESARVLPAIARRICRTEQEFLEAPSPSSLWTAKEACFKALKGSRQPQTATVLEIEDWKTLDSQFETARLKDSQKLYSSQIEGVLMKKGPFTFSFFTLRP